MKIFNYILYALSVILIVVGTITAGYTGLALMAGGIGSLFLSVIFMNNTDHSHRKETK